MPFAGYKDFDECVRKNRNKKNPQAYCGAIKHATEADFSTSQREKLAKSGAAMPDGSYPIRNRRDLLNAIKAFGRAKNPAATKRHIIKRARALGLTELLPSDWSASTKKEGEVDTRRISDLFDVNEADFSVDESTGQMKAKITIIKAGRSKNPRNYTENALVRAAETGVFNGLRMFINHSDKPPTKRSLTEMVSAIESTSWNSESKRLEGEIEFFNKDFFEFAQRAKNYMGNSINALARGDRTREPNGEVIENVTEIVKGHSVDWVIYPAAGGEIQQFMESEGEDVEWGEITLDDLIKNGSSELWEAINDHVKEAAEPDDDDGDDEKDTEETPEPMTKEQIAELVAKAIVEHDEKKAQEAKLREDSQAKLNDLLSKSGLPQKTQRRIFLNFANSTFQEAEVTEAIEGAKEELAAAGAGPKITGMGPSDQGDSVSSHPTGVRVSESVEAAFGLTKES